MALVFGPLAIAGLAWLIVEARTRGKPIDGYVTSLIVLALIEIGGLVYAFRVPTLWVELGPTLRYGSLATAHEVEWSDVQRIWFDREDEYVSVGPLHITLSAHVALVIEINDYKDIRVLVPGDKRELLLSILSRHPCFRSTVDMELERRQAEAETMAQLDGPFDDEPDDEEETQDK